MIDLGHFSLVCAWLLSMYGLLAGFWGAKSGKQSLIRSARTSVYLCCLFSVVSFLALAQAFLVHDYRYVYVWQTSNNAMPPMYLFSAIWGGMDGSMLLWAVIMTIFAATVVWRSHKVPRDLLAGVERCDRILFSRCYFSYKSLSIGSSRDSAP